MKSKFPMTLKIFSLCLIVNIVVGVFPSLIGILAATSYNPFGLITYQFTHAGWLHLISNFFFGLPFMVYVEKRIGEKKMLEAYLICGLGSALLHCIMMMGLTNGLVGSSGSIAGMLAMACMLFGETMADRLLSSMVLGAFLVFQFLPAIYDPFQSIAYWGHIGGALVGMFLVTRFVRYSGERRCLPAKQRLK